MAAEDHLGFADHQAGEAEDLLVLSWTHKVPVIQFLQTHQEVTETGQDELATVDPVVVALTLTCYRFTVGVITFSYHCTKQNSATTVQVGKNMYLKEKPGKMITI